MSSIKSHDVTDIIDRLKLAYSIRTDAALASFLGIKPNTISMWKKRSFLDFNLIFTKCDDISASWLLTGEGTKDNLDLGQGCPHPGEVSGHVEPREFRTVEKFGDSSTSDNKEPYGSFIYVPQVNGEISAGGRRVPDDTVEIRIGFRREWIQRRGDPKNMSLIRVSGDSMEPTLWSGDLVLIDHGRNHVEAGGGIYAISFDNEIMIKRVQQTYHSIKVISDNPKYSVVELEHDAIMDMKINGKVIWFGREIER